MKYNTTHCTQSKTKTNKRNIYNITNQTYLPILFEQTWYRILNKHSVTAFFVLFRDEHENTTPLTVDDLWALESVMEVSDFVQIEAKHEALKNLTFLRNLQYIRGRSL